MPFIGRQAFPLFLYLRKEVHTLWMLCPTQPMKEFGVECKVKVASLLSGRISGCFSALIFYFSPFLGGGGWLDWYTIKAVLPTESSNSNLQYEHCILSPERRGKGATWASTALQGKSHLCIPFLGIARPQSQFPHSCVSDLNIPQDRSDICVWKLGESTI